MQLLKEKINGIFWRGDFDNYYLGHQAEEIFKARIYAPYLEQVVDPIVLDVGGNIGMFSLYASKYAKQVYTLEPSKEHFETIQEMLKFNEITNVKPINKALFMENAKFPFHHNKNKTMYSLHGAVSDGSSAPEEVEAITLDKLFEDEKIDHLNLMKLDVEGSEAEILASPGFAKVAPKIDVVMGELHSWMNRNPQQLVNNLKDLGFIVEQIPNDATLFVARRAA